MIDSRIFSLVHKNTETKIKFLPILSQVKLSQRRFRMGCFVLCALLLLFQLENKKYLQVAYPQKRHKLPTNSALKLSAVIFKIIQ